MKFFPHGLWQKVRNFSDHFFFRLPIVCTKQKHLRTLLAKKGQNIENIGSILRRTTEYREHTNTKRLMTRNIAKARS